MEHVYIMIMSFLCFFKLYIYLYKQIYMVATLDMLMFRINGQLKTEVFVRRFN